MLEKTRGIVLHAFRYGEESMIVSVLTLSRGALTFMVKQPKGRRSSVKAQLLRPLNILELDIDFRERTQMQRIKDMRVAVPFTSLPYEPAKEALAMFLGEVLYHALRHEGQNEPMFLFLEKSMQWLDLAESGYANFHLCLLLQLTRFLGFMPNMEGADGRAVFDLVEGDLAWVLPKHDQFIKPEETKLLAELQETDFGAMALVRLNRQQRGRILRVLNQYYRIHIPDFPELKSLDVLAELFD